MMLLSISPYYFWMHITLLFYLFTIYIFYQLDFLTRQNTTLIEINDNVHCQIRMKCYVREGDIVGR